uniref:Calmodulin-lysine N-methyltransferase n=1 Tax=Alexandrium monilatum TaxID=311494 RepID=A0A7S4PW53_9DINO|mmetsp:Transcript_85383/g.264421  ORF Transcript_85383/g.264421 Transcript_85383/m.264421 type:complete len:255 (+) Transcript_85383:34-798(+)|eukprot:CAMPEP_0175758148 /NCGR_PEP_ID=MMETSP0097-20121207/64852_1 /TAXON_ID=311494 /ORGANISM="Alexandrium monilatum, Strain CCMP3105" /LENGTH=254 /DNA_ID=CAMNT_0017067397 /DNA_START=63 /DNA_END=827 /DNA_ORIENTATION=-
MSGGDWTTVPLAWGGSLRFASPGGAARPSGCRLWASAVALCGTLSRLLEPPAKPPGSPEGVPRRTLRVLELGAGAGAPGLLAAALGCAEVVVSDAGEEALGLLRGNVRRFRTAASAGAVDRLAATRLDFGSAEELAVLAGRFDLVLAADCCYERGAAGRLATAVETLLAPSGMALLADRDRPLGGSDGPVRARLRGDLERFGISVDELDASRGFAEGLAIMGVPGDLVTALIDGRSFILRAVRRPPVVALDEMD